MTPDEMDAFLARLEATNVRLGMDPDPIDDSERIHRYYSEIVRLEDQVTRLQRSYRDAETQLIPHEMKRVPGTSRQKWERIYRVDLQPGDLDPIS